MALVFGDRKEFSQLAVLFNEYLNLNPPSTTIGKEAARKLLTKLGRKDLIDKYQSPKIIPKHTLRNGIIFREKVNQ